MRLQGTFYGAGQDDQGTCSFSQNFANTNLLPWTNGAKLTLALNNNQFDNSAACGLCLMFRGTGAGLGTTPIPAEYTLGFVNNRSALRILFAGLAKSTVCGTPSHSS